jgi:hypothetical protein
MHQQSQLLKHTFLDIHHGLSDASQYVSNLSVAHVVFIRGAAFVWW